MKDYTFYQEFADKSKSQPTGNCIAVFGPTSNHSREAIAGIYETANSPCSSCGVSVEHLKTKCKRVTEEKARRYHPKLFNYLEQ